MRKTRWLVLVLLAATAGGLGYRVRADWRGYDAQNNPAAIRPRPQLPTVMPPAEPARDYAVVAQQNPFHPERNDATPPPPARVSGPPPLVYGSMMLGKEKFALLGAEGDPKPRKVLEGENFNGYKLAEVRAQSVVFEADGSRNEVMLYNAATRLRREHVRTQASSAPPPPAVATAASAPAATTVASAPPQQQPAAPQSPFVPAGLPPAPAGKRYVETPFGPILADANSK
ncbi:MAG TPA: hypothetical protein VFA60_15165 [Terriglobales bacterium]|nr:hypothetical protein [Terriglobales bacterium]